MHLNVLLFSFFSDAESSLTFLVNQKEKNNLSYGEKKTASEKGIWEKTFSGQQSCGKNEYLLHLVNISCHKTLVVKRQYSQLRVF